MKVLLTVLVTFTILVHGQTTNDIEKHDHQFHDPSNKIVKPGNDELAHFS